MDQAAAADTSRRWKMFTAAVQPIEGNRRLRPTGLNVEVEVRGGGRGSGAATDQIQAQQVSVDGRSVADTFLLIKLDVLTHKTSRKSWFLITVPLLEAWKTSGWVEVKGHIQVDSSAGW